MPPPSPTWGQWQGQAESPRKGRVVGGHNEQCGQLWGLLLPDVEQFLSEPAGQRLAHLVEQLGQLNVGLPVLVPQEVTRLRENKVET